MKRVLSIIFFSLILVVITGLFLFIKNPVYKASSTIVFDTKELITLETEKNIIKSRRIAHHVFHKLNLSNHDFYKNLEDPLESLLKKVKVSRVKNTSLIKIDAYEHEPKLAYYISNEFASEYLNPKTKRTGKYNVWIQDYAEVPSKALLPIETAWFLIAIFLLCGILVMRIIFKEQPKVYLKRDKGSIEDNFTLLGHLPRINKSLLYSLDAANYPLITEAFNSIRAKLLFKGAKVFAITSIFPHQGTTISAINLAAMIASSGEKVLLIDANARNPKLEMLFDRRSKHGFFDLVSGSDTNQNGFKYSGVERLYVITVNKQDMKDILEKAKKEFSTIIFDAPAILKDKKKIISIGELCDGVVIVKGNEKLNNGKFSLSKKILEDSNINVLGVITNNQK